MRSSFQALAVRQCPSRLFFPAKGQSQVLFRQPSSPRSFIMSRKRHPATGTLFLDAAVRRGGKPVTFVRWSLALLRSIVRFLSFACCSHHPLSVPRASTIRTNLRRYSRLIPQTGPSVPACQCTDIIGTCDDFLILFFVEEV